MNIYRLINMSIALVMGITTTIHSAPELFAFNSDFCPPDSLYQPLESAVDSLHNSDPDTPSPPMTLHTKLAPQDRAYNDQFGNSVAISADGKTALIGAIGKDSENIEDHGAAYIYIHRSAGWIEQNKLVPSDKAAQDGFGVDVALSADGNTALVGSFLDDINGAKDSGAAYIFVRSGTIWTQQAKLTAMDLAPEDYFGLTVSLSADGNTALIGAKQKDTKQTVNSGAAYIFGRSNTIWTQEAKLVADDGAAEDAFGIAVALSSDGATAIIGATGKDDTMLGIADSGSVYIFRRDKPDWVQQSVIFADKKTDRGFFGNVIALSGDGNTLLIGTGEYKIHAFVLNRTTWMLQPGMSASAPDVVGYGHSIALTNNGNMALSGHPVAGECGNSGFVALFARNEAIWKQVYSKSYAATFGYAVALSADGKTALVSNINEGAPSPFGHGVVSIFSIVSELE
jgi:hypothetical protein